MSQAGETQSSFALYFVYSVWVEANIQEHSKHHVTGRARPVCWEAVRCGAEQRENGQGRPCSQGRLFRGFPPRSQFRAGTWSEAPKSAPEASCATPESALVGPGVGWSVDPPKGGGSASAVGTKQQCGPIAASRYRVRSSDKTDLELRNQDESESTSCFVQRVRI